MDLRAVLYRKNQDWLAHCLELDIAAQARDSDAALASLVSLCDLQVRRALQLRGKVRHVLTPAPREYWTLWFNGHAHSTLENAELRELIRHPHEPPYPLHKLDVREAELSAQSAAHGLALHG
ncbi:MAG: hypothetical protein KY475_11215 [Planctomycetes bacterium]|nr:hypothetical protein [Planctomycetota bacterium]